MQDVDDEALCGVNPFLQLKLLRNFDSSQFIPSLLNFHLVSNDITPYVITITSSR